MKTRWQDINEEKIIQYDGLAKLKDAKVVSGEQRINREDLSDEFKNVVSLEATNNTKRNILFSSGVFTIKEGIFLWYGD